MINLAGRELADDTIKLELKESRIPIHKFFGQHKHEVPWTYQGQLFGWVFTRAWYYWIAVGRMPLPAAKYLYDKDIDKAVRVAGHCAAPSPKEWAEHFDIDGNGLFHFEKEPSKSSSLYPFWLDVLLKGMYVDHPDEQATYSYVNTYHIDTQLGLNLFADTLRELEYLTYKASERLK